MELLLTMHKLIMICKIFNQFTIFLNIYYFSLFSSCWKVFLSVVGYSVGLPHQNSTPVIPTHIIASGFDPSISVRSNSSCGSGHHALSDTSRQHLSSLMSSLSSDLGLHVAHGNEALPPSSLELTIERGTGFVVCSSGPSPSPSLHLCQPQD